MSVEGQNFKATIQAGADLRTQRYKVLDVAGTISANADGAIGVLDTEPNSGQNCSVMVMGHMQAYAGGAITKGARLTVTTSGYMAITNSGDNNVAVGKALVAANSGDLFNFYGNFANAANNL